MSKLSTLATIAISLALVFYTSGVWAVDAQVKVLSFSKLKDIESKEF